jgi:hypothetical protein
VTGRKFSFKSVLDRNLTAKHTGGHENGQAAQRGGHYLLGDVRAMSAKRTFSIGPVLFVVVFISILAAMGLFQPVVRPIQEKMDDRHLAKFSQKITTTDHIVASKWTLYPSRKEMSLSLTGEDAKRVVQAVSSGKGDRQVYSNIWSVRAKFFGGTNVLGEIMIDDGELFLADGRQYRDVSFKLDGDGGSGVLRDLICAPLGKIVHDAEMKELESQ